MQMEPVHPRVARVPGTASADPENKTSTEQGEDHPVTPVLASVIMASEETEEEHE
jgi:hypothetical protein